jgi:hypothetical protein
MRFVESAGRHHTPGTPAIVSGALRDVLGPRLLLHNRVEGSARTRAAKFALVRRKDGPQGCPGLCIGWRQRALLMAA